MSHQAAPTHFFGIPLLDQPLVVRVLAATSAILAFIVGHPLFVRLYVGFGRNLPHILVRQQLKAFLDIHEERCRPTLDPTSTWWSSSRGAFPFAPRGHCVSTTTTHFGTVEGRQLFLYLFFLFTKNCDLVHGLDHGPVLDVVVLVDLGRTFGWTCDVPKVALPHLRRLWSLYWCA